MPIPTELTAGDRKTWTETATDASERVVYVFDNGCDKIEVEGINDGTDHTFTIDGGVSASWAPGWYDSFRIPEDGAGVRGETKRGLSRLRVYPDPLAKRDPTFNEKILQNCRDAMAGRSLTFVEASTFGGSNITRLSIPELQEILKEYERRVGRERERRRIATVGKTRGEILYEM